MARVRPVDRTKGQQPWVVVLMGTPGSGKSTFMKSDDSTLRDNISRQLGCKVPWDNIVVKKLDDVIANAAGDDLKRLWEFANSISDPHERFRAYWANKQHLFTRYAVAKVKKTRDAPDHQSYEFRVGASMINLLTQEHAQYNIAMETTGLSAGLVQFGLTVPQFVNYNKLILLSEIDDVEKAKIRTHSRLIREMNT